MTASTATYKPTASSCIGCGSYVLDLERGWLRNQFELDDPRTYWLCNDCLDRKPHVKWLGSGPYVQRFEHD